MGPLGVIEVPPFPDPGLRLQAGFSGPPIDTLVFERAPQALDQDVVEETTFPIP
jgi:hypothetical protein